MIRIYKTSELNASFEMLQAGDYQNGVWINLIKPTDEEIQEVVDKIKVPIDFIKSALDEEERARIESEDQFTLMLIDIPVTNKEEDKEIGRASCRERV